MTQEVVFSAADLVRQNTGETIPAGGTDADTMFTDDEVLGFLTQCNQLINLSSAAAWRVKAARLSTLVDVQEGNSSRKMSQAYTTAISQAKYYSSLPENPLVMGQTRLGTNRRVMPW